MKFRTAGIFVIVFCLMPLASAQDVKVDKTSEYVGKNRWKWTLFIEAPPDVLDKIKCVEYALHPSFPNPIQVVCDRGSDKEAFALGEKNLRNEPCFHALCSTAPSQAAKQFPLHRCILADERANTLVQGAECLDLEFGQRRMVEPRDEHNAHRVALVPHLMLEGIVEDEATSLTPIAFFVPDPNAAALGHDQAEVGGEEYV